MEATGKFEYLATTGKAEEDLVVSQLKLKTRFQKPFFVGVAEMIEEYKAEDLNPPKN